eukprot:gnl/TRDRNA2_/TRDRNA2_174692_c5_seq1.p1 gnl/TRDRNA2_/TRDRNA2_174692_c5~~gnl/TRDRNA2_/TRDRNA2_174692_c5_seq1.p1  ORF type:complete len:193 (-),score=0.70 gnl/TRDRNA2_/TRDRNA2_174692_c5_seq1:46-624(-)
MQYFEEDAPAVQGTHSLSSHHYMAKLDASRSTRARATDWTPHVGHRSIDECRTKRRTHGYRPRHCKSLNGDMSSEKRCHLQSMANIGEHRIHFGVYNLAPAEANTSGIIHISERDNWEQSNWDQEFTSIAIAEPKVENDDVPLVNQRTHFTIPTSAWLPTFLSLVPPKACLQLSLCGPSKGTARKQNSLSLQ